ncbi:alpha/beta fold hydrolase [Rhodoligotrophos defluvii]|uniref:alpha/beta fold hydrolase n=1 Tax=Rhodoligotrophos defluvii TaxID=2561934 RepID=UPI0010C97127|nr:alpha/beta hydrolase [Rhodoligotrophos defluvii]
MEDLFPGFDHRRITTFGAEISLRLGGSGPALVLLHGYPQTHAMWHKLAPKLAEHFTLVLPDLRGYGQSSCPPNDPDNFTYSKRAMAQDVLQVMRELGFRSFMAAGHDRGARVAYRLALDEPEAVERLAVLDIIPTYDMWSNFSVKMAMSTYHWLFLAQPHPLPEMLIEPRAREFLDYTLASWSGTGDLSAFAPAALASYREAFAAPGRVAASCGDYRAGQTYDYDADKADHDAGHRIACPVLVLWGDTGFPAGVGTPLDIWRQWAPAATGAAIAAGHFLAEEAPAAVLAQLLPFFKDKG